MNYYRQLVLLGLTLAFLCLFLQRFMLYSSSVYAAENSVLESTILSPAPGNKNDLAVARNKVMKNLLENKDVELAYLRDKLNIVKTKIANIKAAMPSMSEHCYEQVATGLPALPSDVIAEVEKIKTPSPCRPTEKWCPLSSKDVENFKAETDRIIALQILQRIHKFADWLQDVSDKIDRLSDCQNSRRVCGAVCINGSPADDVHCSYKCK